MGETLTVATSVLESLQAEIEELKQENATLRATQAQMLHGNGRIGSWLSASLSDSKVCAEMKADVEAWFESHDVPAAIANKEAFRATAELVERAEGVWLSHRGEIELDEDCEGVVSGFVVFYYDANRELRKDIKPTCTDTLREALAAIGEKT